MAFALANFDAKWRTYRLTRSRITSMVLYMQMQNAFKGRHSIKYGLCMYKFVNTVWAREWPSNQETIQERVRSTIMVCSFKVSPSNFKRPS